MGMNDQYQQMIRFTKALEGFNDQLNTSMRELEEKHDGVTPFWQDEMRRDHDREWAPLHDRMKQYATLEGPRFVEFLRSKLRFLERYLYGG